MKYVFHLLILLLIFSCATSREPLLDSRQEEESVVELRGVWIASVENIDWPKSKNESIDELKHSFIQILDFYQQLNFNAIFLQIRTAGDALYSSQYAPWSRYISGTEGVELKEDLLPWLIDQTHARGMEFHAWMNPYRATTSLDTTILSSSHDYYLHKDWMLKYGSKYYYNPGLKDVQSHLLDVVDEVVSEYNIDGIHFDDYFYPYRILNESFSDSSTYNKEAKPNQSLGDWRRNNINSFIRTCHQRIHNKKSYVQFGVSPFGVWRNQSKDTTGSATRAGQTVYDDLYADTRTWIKNQWVDYIAPQLYWSMDYPAASHRVLVDWWKVEANNIPLYIGLGAYKFENNHDSAWFDIQEIPRQIIYSRATNITDGFIVFSAKSLMQKEHLYEQLKSVEFRTNAYTKQQDEWHNYTLQIKTEILHLPKGTEILFSNISQQVVKLKIVYVIPGKFLKPSRTVKLDSDFQNGRLNIKIPPQVDQLYFQGINTTGNLSRKTQLTIKKDDKRE